MSKWSPLNVPTSPGLGLSRRRWLAMSAGAAAVVGLGSNAATALPAGMGFTIGTGELGSANYLIGGRLAQILSRPPGTPACKPNEICGVDGLFAVAQTSPGPVASLLALAAEEVDSAFCQADVAFAAFQGRAIFGDGGALTSLRAIAALHDEVLQIVVTEAAEDGLAGKRLAIGTEFSGADVMADPLFRMAGIQDAVTTVETSTDAALSGLADGELDGFLIIRGLPSQAVSEAVTRYGAGLLDLSDEVRAQLVAERPFMFTTDIPALTYPGVDDKRTVGVRSLWLVREDTPSDLVMEVLDALWRPANLAALRASHPAAERISRERALLGLSVPLHDAAVDFYAGRAIDEIDPAAVDEATSEATEEDI